MSFWEQRRKFSELSGQRGTNNELFSNWQNVAKASLLPRIVIQ